LTLTDNFLCIASIFISIPLIKDPLSHPTPSTADLKRTRCRQERAHRASRRCRISPLSPAYLPSRCSSRKCTPAHIRALWLVFGINPRSVTTLCSTDLDQEFLPTILLALALPRIAESLQGVVAVAITESDSPQMSINRKSSSQHHHRLLIHPHNDLHLRPL
jgi:hypothetical protein